MGLRLIENVHRTFSGIRLTKNPNEAAELPYLIGQAVLRNEYGNPLRFAPEGILLYTDAGGMNMLEYMRATRSELEMLVRTRMIVLRAANRLPDDVNMDEVERQSRAYYRRALASGEHVAYLVMDGDTFVGAGGVSFYGVMPTYHNPTGQKAYIMNMYTAPEYRRRGIARRTLELLVDEARSRGVTAISLEATDMGRTLYEKFGFVPMGAEMELSQDVNGQNME